MRKVKEIKQIDDKSVLVILDNLEEAVLYSFGGVVYTTVSEGLSKVTLSELKKDALLFNFCAKTLEEKWVYETV